MSKSSLLYNKLSYITEERTISSIATETGIPYTTLYYYNKKVRNLPSKYENALSSLYNRETYRRIRKVGYDVKTASSMRYWNPEKIHITLGSDLEIAQRYTFFNVRKIDPDNVKTLQDALKSDYWRYYFERITSSIQRRQKYIDENGEERWNSG